MGLQSGDPFRALLTHDTDHDWRATMKRLVCIALVALLFGAVHTTIPTPTTTPEHVRIFDASSLEDIGSVPVIEGTTVVYEGYWSGVYNYGTVEDGIVALQSGDTVRILCIRGDSIEYTSPTFRA